MRHDRKARRATVTPLDPEKTLYEVGSKEVWQSLLTTADGHEIGPVIRQVVEPRMYTVRYLVVYDTGADRHVLVPSNTIVDITASRVHSSLTRHDVQEMPTFSHTVTRSYEEDIYQSVGRMPHWLEEEIAMGLKPEEEPSGKPPDSQ